MVGRLHPRVCYKGLWFTVWCVPHTACLDVNLEGSGTKNTSYSSSGGRLGAFALMILMRSASAPHSVFIIHFVGWSLKDWGVVSEQVDWAEKKVVFFFFFFFFSRMTFSPTSLYMFSVDASLRQYVTHRSGLSTWVFFLYMMLVRGWA